MMLMPSQKMVPVLVRSARGVASWQFRSLYQQQERFCVCLTPKSLQRRCFHTSMLSRHFHTSIFPSSVTFYDSPRVQIFHQYSSLHTNVDTPEKQQDNSKCDSDQKSPNSCPEKQQMFETFRAEIEELKQKGKAVPDDVTDYHLDVMCSLSNAQRRKYLTFLFLKEQKRRNRKEKQRKGRGERTEESSESTEESRSLHTSSYLRRITPQMQSAAQDWKLASAALFGTKIAIDFDYEELMSRREIVNLVAQIIHLNHDNRNLVEPFDLHWCNLKEDSLTRTEMRRMNVKETLISISEEGLLQSFPRETLLYLSGDSPNIMTSFDPDRVYIIGGFVDKSIKTGCSLAKAKRQNIEHCRLPLDTYLKWSNSAKQLTLNQVFNILHTLKSTGDWNQAMVHVPSRKHEGLRVESGHTTQKGPQSQSVHKSNQADKFSFSRSKSKRLEKRFTNNDMLKVNSTY